MFFSIPDAVIDADSLNSYVWSKYYSDQRGIDGDHRDWVQVRVARASHDTVRSSRVLMDLESVEFINNTTMNLVNINTNGNL